MHRAWLVITIWLITAWLAIDRPRVDSPRPGEALQGLITITGSTNLKDFQSAEVAFAYDQDGDLDWFLVQRSSETVKDGVLAVWDTTTITDGTYRLRVRVLLQNGQAVDTIISGLRVRNYSIVETSTPEASQASIPATSQPTLTGTPRPTATSLPANPAEVTQRGLLISLLQGSIYAIVFMALFGLYLAARRLLGG
jgi:hypothetical protein